MSSQVHSENSTTVRSPALPGALSAVLTTMPWLAKPLLSRLFLTPQRKKGPAHEQRPSVVGTILVGGVRLKVRARGTGPVVLLVHGWRGRATQFSSLSEALTNHGYTVVSFDMKAHGESAGSTTSLVEFMDAISKIAALVGPLHAVVGHSLGGMATALSLSRGLQVQGAVLIAPMVSFDFALDEFSRVLHLTPELRALTAVAAEERTGITRAEADLTELPRPTEQLTLIHDQEDQRTPFQHSEFLAQRWGAPLVSTYGLGHSRILGDEQVIWTIVSRLDALPRAPVHSLEDRLTALPELRI